MGLPTYDLIILQMILRKGSVSARRKLVRNAAENAELRWRRTRNRASVSSGIVVLKLTAMYHCVEALGCVRSHAT